MRRGRAAPAVAAPAAADAAAETRMPFFLTSAGAGNGADLGGLAGADQRCEMLADAAGAGDLTWHAYLSASATADAAAVNARDRIGSGPWYNHALVQVASDIANLHGESNGLTKESELNAMGAMTTAASTASGSRRLARQRRPATASVTPIYCTDTA